VILCAYHTHLCSPVSSHTHTHTHTNTHTHAHTHTLSLLLDLTYAHAVHLDFSLFLSLSHTHTLSFAVFRCQILTLSHYAYTSRSAPLCFFLLDFPLFFSSCMRAHPSTRFLFLSLSHSLSLWRACSVSLFSLSLPVSLRLSSGAFVQRV